MTRFWFAVVIWVAASAGCVSTSTDDEVLPNDMDGVEAQSKDASKELIAVPLLADDVTGMRAGIRPVENIVSGDQPVQIVFYLSNDTDETVRVLPWGTPLERTLTADVFVVTFNEDRLPYVGLMVKRAAPSADDYLALQAGEKVEMVVNLSSGYDMRGIGDYQIELELLYLQSADGELKAVIVEDTVSVSRQ